MYRPPSQEINERCICEICTCGKHRCPVPRVKGDFQTSYGNHYKQPEQDPGRVKANETRAFLLAQPSQLFASPPPDKSHVPFVGQTEYSKRYKHNPEDNQKRRIIESVAVTSSPAQDNKHCYKDHFKGFEMPQSPPPIDMQVKRPYIPFDGQTTYKMQFKEAPPLALKKEDFSDRRRSMSDIKRAPFVGETSYNNHYKAHEMSSPKLAPRQSLVNVYAPKEGPKFEGESSYKGHYRQHEPDMISRLQRPCPCTQLHLPTTNQKDKLHLHYNQHIHSFQ